MENDKGDPAQQEKNKGLYTPQYERDSCGVGLLADLSNNPSFYILDTALTMLENMEHRGACGYEENTGDGAGVLTQIPHRFFYSIFSKLDISLPAKGKYGVGMFFFPKDETAKKHCYKVIREFCRAYDFEIIYNRIVPVDNSMVGQSALDSEPDIEQIFFKTSGFNNKDVERRFYFLRSSILNKIYFSFPDLVDDFYIASLSSKTIVYKGMLTASQLRTYYLDLQNPKYESAVAIVHSRFSTNTSPKWKLAQPFRCIAHNGEINTIQSNLNWWNAREKHMELIAKDQPYLSKAFPVCDQFISDSGNFDNVVDFLLRASRSIPHSIMMMIPEAWQNDEKMEAHKKAFYQYHDALMEPWDGPASICFTDGTLVGATLDRNGLRPSRYLLTSDNLLVLGSETGCIDIDPTTIIKKGRLQPGKMLLADLNEHRIISDKEVKDTICNRKPYQQWIAENSVELEGIPSVEQDIEYQLELNQRQGIAGFCVEDEKLILAAMVQNAKEPIGSMGLDIPLAVLSKKDQHIGNYFKQDFAQVTNPPIDSIREKYYMSLSSVIGGGSKIIGTGPEETNVIRCKTPVLTKDRLHGLLAFTKNGFHSFTLDITYQKGAKLKARIEQLCEETLTRIKDSGTSIICLSDANVSATNISIPSLMITGALHHFLIEKGLRKEVAIVVNASDIWETQHLALLMSFGADLVCPYLAHETVQEICLKNEIKQGEGLKKYNKALEKGLLKIMSKLGVSTLASYKGAQTFEALGISKEVIDLCFKGTTTRIEGMGFADLQKETENKYQKYFDAKEDNLNDQGIYRWRKSGEYHLFNPTTIHLLQHATQNNKYDTYKKFANEIDKAENNASTLRSFIGIKEGTPIPLSEVESVASILKRFASGAMSFGSISEEAHTTLAMAMNRIGGKSNSGEGGEDEERFYKMDNGDWQRSATKQVASGRFGVNINYLTNAIELQIKIAQGAKPGEGGQLPGHKVDANIARVRNSTPGVGLISPPPHHDIYSIEDLAQLIFDLKNANQEARISVKLVSKSGVGVIASGVAKAHADHILISGYDGGTGASPLSSLRHAGLPWEIGLSETHQTLMKNGLRDRVVLQTDGQLRTGRDLAIATMLGAEEWGIATAALVVEGCILMRKCHLNTCPVGIATQDKYLRKKFNGKVEHLVNYFTFIAEHLREIMASLGVKSVNDLVGKTEFLEIRNIENHWKTKHLQLNSLFHKESHPNNKTMYCSATQDHGLDNVLDHTLLAKSVNALNYKKSYVSNLKIQSTDRAVGTMLSNEIAKRYGTHGLPDGAIHFKFKGSAGQSFCAFGAKGILFQIEGDANDYFGKGLSGAVITIRPDARIDFKRSENTIIGNVALYGATSGEAYINGKAGDRFAVRNSGAKTVAEGVGDNGCEYMTGGVVIVLGEIGRNFAAGMSGGIAYLYKHDTSRKYLLNRESIEVETPDGEDIIEIKKMVSQHTNLTGSKLGFEILINWEEEQNNFVKIFPVEYKRALLKREKTLIEVP